MSENIRGFDGIRGLAAVAVVCDHAGFFWPIATLPAVGLVEGSTAVTWFFVLSGLLITRLLIAEHRATGTVSLSSFYIRRFLRIFPLYYFALALTTLLLALGIADASYPAIDLAAAYVYNFVSSAYYYPIIGHTWSLAVEEHFYIVWPLLFRSCYGSGTRLLKLALASGIALAYPLLVAGVRVLPQINEHYFLQRWTPIAGASIAWGCLAALSLDELAVEAVLQAHPRLLVAAGAALYAAPLAQGVLPWGLPHHLQAAGITCLLVWIVLHQRSRIVGWLEAVPLRYLGRVSYGIYMYQGVLLTTGPARPGQPWPLPTPQALALLLCVVPLSYALLERPLLKLKARFRGAGREHAADLASAQSS